MKCKKCKHWERYEISRVGLCVNDKKYNDIRFGKWFDCGEYQEYDPNNLPDAWYCSFETDEDDHCKYGERK